MQKDVRSGAKGRLLGVDREQLIEQIFYHLLFAALGALIGSAELLFGVKPFGMALAAAATVYAPAIAAGIALYAIIVRDWLTLVTLVGVVTLRALGAFLSGSGDWRNRPYLRERPLYRVASATLAVFCAGIYTIVRGGYRYYDLFGILLALLAAPLAAFLYIGLFEKKDAFFPYSREAGAAALFLTGVFAMREVSFFGIYPAVVAAALIAFYLVSHRDILWGAVGGGLAGLCFAWRMAPAFLLCGLCYGLLQKSSRGGGILLGCGAAAAYAFAIARAAGLTLLLPGLLTAGALYLAFDSAGLVEGTPHRHLTLARRRAAQQAARAGEQAASEKRLSEISGAFLDLSGTFFELSSRLRRPGLVDLRNLCDRAFDSACPGCRNRDICWGSEYHATAAAVSALGARLHTHGAVGSEQIPAPLAARCPNMGRILDTVNDGCTRLTEEALRGDKTSVVAMDYAAIGRVLGEVLEENRAAFACDHAAGERILARLLRGGYTLESVSVCGKTHRQVMLRGVRLPGRHLKLRELRAILEQHCRFRLGDPVVQESDGVSDLVFPERTRYEVETVKETRAKGKDGRYCGDTVLTVSNDGYDYVILCDGMGSGNAAALTSALASTFLSRLLAAGNRADTSLRMLNGFLAARGTRESETSTTVDLLEIDRISGEASLFKCGAAPSFLLRNGEVTRFHSRTAPVGILESLDAERIRFTPEEGDILVQVSDGITRGEEDCGWLSDMLRTEWDGNMESFARMALNRATQQGSDDLSVLITRIRRAPAPGEERASA